jgi:hypothetical protein
VNYLKKSKAQLLPQSWADPKAFIAGLQNLGGKRGITDDTALRLGRWFGTGPDIWMNLQINSRFETEYRARNRAPL